MYHPRSLIPQRHGKSRLALTPPFLGDLPQPEWMAFGDPESPRILYMLHHEDDDFPDNYISRPDMTVLGFGRQDKNKFLETKQTFSIGFVESTDYTAIDQTIKQVLE